MRKLLLALVLSSVACAAAEDLPSAELAPPEEPEVWLVELAGAPLAGGGAARALDRTKQLFDEEARVQGLALVERYHYRHLWHGVAVAVRPGDVERLRRLPGVVQVGPVDLFEGEYTDDMYTGQNASSNSMIGADVVRNTLGYTGEGVRVAMIDSGLDYHHPAFGGCLGPGCRVEIGWDFVGDAYDPDLGVKPTPDDDPDESCYGHGTNVTGILAANGGGLTGVAPGVSLAIYRVLNCRNRVGADVILTALEAAYLDNVRVVSFSIGGPGGWSNDVIAKAMDNLVDRGVIVVTSLGNNGTQGVWSVGLPGAGDKNISAASVDNIASTYRSFTISPDDHKVAWLNAAGAVTPPFTGTFEVARTGTNTSTADACTALPAGSLTGKIALTRRGTCGGFTKARNAVAAGAVGCIVYDDRPNIVLQTGGTGAIPTVPVVGIGKVDGELMDARIQAGPLYMTWGVELVDLPAPSGGLMSSFSAYGPTVELQFKPDLTAPGGNIFSTYPIEMSSYTTTSGTSNAAPHVAGSAALLLEAIPGITPAQVAQVLQNTAVPVLAAAGSTDLESVIRQGAGLIQIDDALQATSVVSPSELSLGEVSPQAARTLSVTNLSASEVTFDVGHAPALAVTGHAFTPTRIASAATVSFSAATVTVAPGQTATIEATIAPAASLEERGLFSGFLTLTPQGGGQTLRVPYMGLKGDYQTITVLTPTPPVLSRPNGDFTYTDLPSGDTFTLDGLDQPTVRVHLNHFSEHLKIEVLSRTGKRYGIAFNELHTRKAATATDRTAYRWDGTAELNKVRSLVPNGEYVLRVTSLKPMGDPENPEHVEVWTSPRVTLNHP
jgi:minor extracellular serine protease Vpr